MVSLGFSVVAVVVAVAELLALFAIKRKSYAVFAVKPVIVALEAFAPGVGVRVIQLANVPDSLYCNV